MSIDRAECEYEARLAVCALPRRYQKLMLGVLRALPLDWDQRKKSRPRVIWSIQKGRKGEVPDHALAMSSHHMDGLAGEQYWRITLVGGIEYEVEYRMVRRVRAKDIQREEQLADKFAKQWGYVRPKGKAMLRETRK